MKTRTKIVLISVIMILMITLTGCFQKSPYTTITVEDLQKKVENNESFALYIGSQTCEFCTKLRESLISIKKDNDYALLYIDIYTLSEEERATLKTEIEFDAYPLIAFFENGIEKQDDRMRGNKPKETIIQKFKEMGIIKDE